MYFFSFYQEDMLLSKFKNINLWHIFFLKKLNAVFQKFYGNFNNPQRAFWEVTSHLGRKKKANLI